jgi:uncharacterized protein YndB with AHSA1/START domain
MTAQPNAPAPDTSDREILISRVFDAPRELVWQAMTDPKQVVHWWGPRGFTTTIETMEFRVGGVWKQTMHGPGGANYPNKSMFREIVPLERIVYSHGGGREGGPGASFVATWSFETVESNKTKLTMRLVFPSADARDFVAKEFGAIEGGKQTLGRLSEFLAAAPLVIERDFDAPMELVWRAITDFDQMKQWYMRDLKAFEPAVGFQTEFTVHYDGKDFLHLWKVTDVVAGRKIAYLWKYPAFPGECFVTFELSTVQGKTRLRLMTEGLASFQPEQNPDLSRGNFLAGWTALAAHLRDFLAGAAPQS